MGARHAGEKNGPSGPFFHFCGCDLKPRFNIALFSGPEISSKPNAGPA
jgi:hypothetical protein